MITSESIFSKPWGWFKANVEKKSEENSSVSEKAESVGSSFFSQATSGLQTFANKVKETGYSTGLNLAKNLATLGYHPDEADQEKINLLKKYTYSDDLPILLSAASASVSAKILQNVDQSDQPESVKKFLKDESLLVQQLINSGLLQLAVNLAEKEKESKGLGSAEPVTISSVFESIRKILADSLPNFEEKMAGIEAITNKKERNLAKNALLEPAIENLMALCFPNGSEDIIGLNFGKSVLYQTIKETVMPEIVLEIIESGCKQTQQKKAVESALLEELSRFKQGSTHFKLIDSACTFFADLGAEKIRALAKSKAKDLSLEIQGMKTESAKIDALKNLIQELCEEKNTAGNFLKSQVSSQIKILAFKHIAKNLTQISSDDPTLSVGQLILNSCGIIAETLQSKDQKINFQTLAQEFLEKSGICLSEDLPSLFGLNEAIGDAALNTLLPEILSSLHEECTSWMKKKEENTKKLEDLFKTSHPEEAAKFIGNYVSQYLPWQLNTSAETTADLILKSFENRIQAIESHAAKNLLDSLQASKIHLKPFLIDILKTMGTSKEKSAGKVWDFAKDYAESASLEFLVRISEKIEALEKKSGAQSSSTASFEALIDLLKIADEKLEDEGEERPEMNSSQMSKKLMSAAKLQDATTIPLPGLIKDELWKFFKEKTLPNTLDSVFASLNEDYAKDAILLGVLKHLNDSLPQGSLSELMNGSKEKKDSSLKALDIECGTILIALFQKLPKSDVSELFSNLADLEIIPPESIGALVRNYLKGTSLLQIFDLAITKILPQIHKGKWMGEKGKEVFEPKGGTYAFNLPKNEKEKAAMEAKLKHKAKLNQKKLINEGAELISSQIGAGIENFLKSVWDTCMNGLGKTSISLKQFVEGIAGCGVISMLFKGLAWIFKPIVSVGKSQIERTFIKPYLKAASIKAKSPQAKKIMKSWEEKVIEILENKVQRRRLKRRRHLELKHEELSKIKKMRDADLQGDSRA